MNRTIPGSRKSTFPSVSVSQWVLVILSVCIALYSSFFSSHRDLATLLVFLTTVNVILSVNLIREALRTGVFGKLLFTSCVFFFFWMDALIGAFQNLPFAVPPRLLILAGQFHPDLIHLAYFYVSLFHLMLFVGYSIRPRLVRMFSWIRSRTDSTSKRTYLLRYLLAACALYPLLLSHGFDLDVTVDALLTSRSGGPEGEDIGLLHYLYFFGMYGAAILLAEALVFQSWRSTWSRAKFLVVGAIAAIPFIMLWGTRHHWLFVALPSCVLLLVKYRGRIRALTLVRWGILLLVVLFVAQLQLAIRQRGWTEISNLAAEEILIPGSGQFVSLLYAEHLVPDIHDYFLEPAEPYFLIHWIPRRFWPNKPVMESWEYYNDSYSRGHRFNVTPSVIGQFHLNWGLAGVVFIGLWLGFLTRLADRALFVIDIQRQHAMAVTIGMFYAFVASSFRFYSPIYFTYCVFAFLAMILLSWRQPVQKASGSKRAYRFRQASLRQPRVRRGNAAT